MANVMDTLLFKFLMVKDQVSVFFFPFFHFLYIMN